MKILQTVVKGLGLALAVREALEKSASKPNAAAPEATPNAAAPETEAPVKRSGIEKFLLSFEDASQELQRKLGKPAPYWKTRTPPAPKLYGGPNQYAPTPAIANASPSRAQVPIPVVGDPFGGRIQSTEDPAQRILRERREKELRLARAQEDQPGEGSTDALAPNLGAEEQLRRFEEDRRLQQQLQLDEQRRQDQIRQQQQPVDRDRR